MISSHMNSVERNNNRTRACYVKRNYSYVIGDILSVEAEDGD